MVALATAVYPYVPLVGVLGVLSVAAWMLLIPFVLLAWRWQALAWATGNDGGRTLIVALVGPPVAMALSIASGWALG